MKSYMKNLLSLLLIGITSSCLQAEENILEEMSLADMMLMETEIKADVGRRDGSANFLYAKTAVDVITSKQIEDSGLTSLVDVLRYFIPSFNAPETSIADGTDHVREYTLRGMSPDQVLVLINGKRVHTSAMIHVNETIGRGTSHVDLDTIALNAIEKVEILRDGAAAQYGSDAIAGVINISLKGIGHKNSISVHTGQRAKSDGTQLSVDTFISIPLKYDGFVNIAMQAKNQERTNRAGIDNRLVIPVVSTYVGVPESESFTALLNSEIVFKDDTILYSRATMNYKDSTSSTFYRDSNATHQGFLPLLNLKNLDYSVVIGLKGEIGNGYFWDLSNSYGYSNIKHFLSNTMNYSQSTSSLSSYDIGKLTSTQNTTNLDMTKNFDYMNLSFGAEYRYESYEIGSGMYDSYIGTGSEGFPGYKPENEVDVSRSSYAVYLDSTFYIFDEISTEFALRHENYSDFGKTTNAKLAFSYKPMDNLLLRTSASTGFRAPSVVQSDYSKTSSLGGILVSVAAPDSSLAQAHGAQDLKAEKSKHFTLGSVYQVSKDTYFMIDYFYIDVEDKIVYSDLKTDLTLAEKALYGVNGLLYFTNGMDTKTQGVDIKFKTKYIFRDNSLLDFSVWYSHNENKVTSLDGVTLTKEKAIESIDLVENGQPKDNIKILASYYVDNITSTLNINRFGSYYQMKRNELGVQNSYKFEAAWTVDIDIQYKLTDSFKLAVGGNNIFDTLPNKWDGLSGGLYGYDGIKQYSRYSPFGYSGAFYYIRASYEF